jgi:hypothetical protein
MLLQRFTWLGLVVVLILSRNALAQSKESAIARPTANCTMKVDDLSIFYREAGPKGPGRTSGCCRHRGGQPVAADAMGEVRIAPMA